MKRMMGAIGALACASLLVGTQALAAPVLMSEDWGKEACEAWNKDPVLTDKLAASGWAKNDGGKGFKVMQVYREDCKDSPKVEMRISLSRTSRNQTGNTMPT